MDQEYSLKDKGRLYKLVAVLVAVLILFVLVKTFGELKTYRFIGGNPDLESTITVRGEGEVFAVSDIATFTFSVMEESKTVAGAQDTATKKTNQIIGFLEGEGIEEKDIKTTSYNIYPKYEYNRQPCTEYSCPPQKSTIIGYEVSQSIEVKVREADRAGEILAGIGSYEVSNLSGLTLTVDNEEDLLSEAREKAVKNAREKAEELARVLGVSLVRVVSYSENGNNPPYFKAYAEVAEVGMGASDVAAPEIPRGENKITSNVTISYEIR